MVKKISRLVMYNYFRSLIFAPNFSQWSCKLFKLSKFSIGLLPKESVFSKVRKESSSKLGLKVFSLCVATFYVQLPNNCLGQEQNIRNNKCFD